MKQYLINKINILKKINCIFVYKFILIMFMFFIGGNLILAEELIKDNNNGMIVRISEIEVYPEYLDEYLKYAKDVAQDSVKKEKGVVSIYPMQIIKDNTQIRILEIYKNKDAYQQHIKSSHFKKYKEGTLHMVKHLDLVDGGFKLLMQQKQEKSKIEG